MDFLSKQMLMNLNLVFYYWVESIVRFFLPQRDKNVSQDTVLITGAGRGLGRELSLRFAEKGSKVVLIDVDRVSLTETHQKVQQIQGAKGYMYVCDVTDRQAVAETAKKVKQEVGVVTILINNAAVIAGKRFLDLTEDQIVKTFNVNVISHFWTTRAFLPDMMGINRGHIVTIASLAGHSGLPRLTDYSASKFAAVGFTESLRMELMNEDYDQINVTEVSPYFANTGMYSGVESGVIPMLSTARVADAVMRGILTNREVVYVPLSAVFFLALKSVMPVKAIYSVLRALGVAESITDRFEGNSVVTPEAPDTAKSEVTPKVTEAKAETSSQ